MLTSTVPFVILTAGFKAMKFKVIQRALTMPNQILLALICRRMVMKDKRKPSVPPFAGMAFLLLTSER
jgi:BarA-like signal transduction histidine kinase